MSRHFTVPGKPVPQGSMRAFAMHGKAFTTSSNAGPLGRYRNDIANSYQYSYGGSSPYHGPVEVFITFQFARPKGHYNANGDLKDGGYAQPAPRFVTRKPDIDKLCRAVNDALTGHAYPDDSQVASINAVMVYGEDDETRIRVSELPNIP